MSLTVLGSPLSSYVRKVVVSLRLKGVDFDLDPTISPFDLPEGFNQLNPLKRIPVIKHDDKVLADSAVICRYLEEIYPEQPLIPNDPYLAARTAWFEKFADYELGKLMTLKAFRLLLLFPIMKRNVDADQVRAELATKLPPLLDYLDQEIGENTYLVGDSFTLADLSTVSQFISYLYSGEQLDKERWPNLARYLDNHFASERFAAMIEKEQGLIAKMRKRAGLID